MEEDRNLQKESDHINSKEINEWPMSVSFQIPERQTGQPRGPLEQIYSYDRNEFNQEINVKDLGKIQLSNELVKRKDGSEYFQLTLRTIFNRSYLSEELRSLERELESLRRQSKEHYEELNRMLNKILQHTERSERGRRRGAGATNRKRARKDRRRRLSSTKSSDTSSTLQKSESSRARAEETGRARQEVGELSDETGGTGRGGTTNETEDSVSRRTRSEPSETSSEINAKGRSDEASRRGRDRAENRTRGGAKRTRSETRETTDEISRSEAVRRTRPEVRRARPELGGQNDKATRERTVSRTRSRTSKRARSEARETSDEVSAEVQSAIAGSRSERIKRPRLSEKQSVEATVEGRDEETRVRSRVSKRVRSETREASDEANENEGVCAINRLRAEEANWSKLISERQKDEASGGERDNATNMGRSGTLRRATSETREVDTEKSRKRKAGVETREGTETRRKTRRNISKRR